jgi:hypothetical protein
MMWIRLFFFAVPVGFIAAGLWLLISGGQSVAEAEGWETTQGIVLSSDRIDPRLMSDGRTSGNRYNAAISYRYDVGGRTYHNDRVWLTQNAGWATTDGADEFLEDYRPGAPVAVIYDPQDPARSALRMERGWMLPLVLLGFGLMALYTAIKAMRQYERGPQRKRPAPRAARRD